MTQTHNTSGPEGSILTALDQLAENAPPEGLTLAQLFDELDERAFGAILFALAIPCCIPFLYAVPQIVALPMAAVAFQMVLGRHEPWLPEKFAGRYIKKAGLERISKGGRKFFGWAEKIARPRLTFLASPIAERLVGMLLLFFCASILVPLPATNTVPGFGVALVSFGLMARDGLMMIVGMLLGTIWITLLITVVVLFGLTVITSAEGTSDVIRPLLDMIGLSKGE